MTQAFNLSQLANFVNTSGQLNAATGLYNQTPVGNGGTGRSSVTSGAVLIGAGTSAMTELSGTTPGTVIASSPTGWTAAPNSSVAGGDYISRTYTSPSPWTAPATLKAVRVTVIGGGGAGGPANSTPGLSPNPGRGGGGGSGAYAQAYYDAPALSPLTITAGAGTNSFGALVSCTGGASAPAVVGTNGGGGAGGSYTPSPATIIASNGFAGASGGAVAIPTNSGNSTGANTFALGYGGLGGGSGVSPGGTGIGYGSGGGGAAKAGPGPVATGGAGAPGIVIVEEFY